MIVDEFMKKKMAIIEQTYTLENFDEMFETGFFENKYEKRQCKRHYKLDFFGFSNITTNSKQCLAFQGHVDMFKSIFQNYAHRFDDLSLKFFPRIPSTYYGTNLSRKLEFSSLTDPVT